MVAPIYCVLSHPSDHLFSFIFFFLFLFSSQATLFSPYPFAINTSHPSDHLFSSISSRKFFFFVVSFFFLVLHHQIFWSEAALHDRVRMGLDLDLGFQNTHMNGFQNTYSLNMAVGVSVWCPSRDHVRRSCSGPGPHPPPFRFDLPHHDAYPLVVTVSILYQLVVVIVVITG